MFLVPGTPRASALNKTQLVLKYGDGSGPYLPYHFHCEGTSYGLKHQFDYFMAHNWGELSYIVVWQDYPERGNVL